MIDNKSFYNKTVQLIELAYDRNVYIYHYKANDITLRMRKECEAPLKIKGWRVPNDK